MAAEMCARGATVYTVDIDPERAEIDGCLNISEGSANARADWWTVPSDAIVPCSKSGLLNAQICHEMDTRAIIGATNLPFATDQAYAISEKRGTVYIPEGVSSAGAVIADSVEHLDKRAFCEAAPEMMYKYGACVCLRAPSKCTRK